MLACCMVSRKNFEMKDMREGSYVIRIDKLKDCQDYFKRIIIKKFMRDLKGKKNYSITIIPIQKEDKIVKCNVLRMN